MERLATEQLRLMLPDFLRKQKASISIRDVWRVNHLWVLDYELRSEVVQVICLYLAASSAP